MDVPENSIRADHVDIKLNQAIPTSNEPQRLKLYNNITFLQKIKLWLIVSYSGESVIINFFFIASFYHLLHTSHSTL